MYALYIHAYQSIETEELFPILGKKYSSRPKIAHSAISYLKILMNMRQ